MRDPVPDLNVRPALLPVIDSFIQAFAHAWSDLRITFGVTFGDVRAWTTKKKKKKNSEALS
jgi:hypothetical protein